MIFSNINYRRYISFHRFVGNQKFKLGNISSKYILNKELILNEVAKCNDCICKSTCVGVCMHDNYIISGEINLPFDEYCNYMIKLFEKTIIEYTKLSDEDKKIFE